MKADRNISKTWRPKALGKAHRPNGSKIYLNIKNLA